MISDLIKTFKIKEFLNMVDIFFFNISPRTENVLSRRILKIVY